MKKNLDIKTVFSLNLKEARRRAGYSVLELARESHISRQHIRDLELANKYATLKTLCKLAEALEVPIGKLIAFKTRPKC